VSKIEEHANALAEDETSVKEAEGIRKKEKEDFKAAEKSLQDSINALDRAMNVLSRKSASLVQTQVNKKDIRALLDTISSVINGASLTIQDSSKLTAFMQGNAADKDEEDDGLGELTAPTAKNYNSHSGGITDMIEDMKQKAVGQLKVLRTEEQNRQNNFNLVKGSLMQEIKVANNAIAEAKESKNGASVLQASVETDKAASTKELTADTKALSDAKTDCIMTADEFDLSQKGRAEEMAAVDQALEALGGVKNKQAGYSFLQLDSKHDQFEVVNALRNLAQAQHSAVLTQLAGRVSAAMTIASRTGNDFSADPFKKVKGMVAEMITKLEKEIGSAGAHKAYCDKSIAESKESKAKQQLVMDKQTGQLDKAKAKATSLQEDTTKLEEELATLTKEQGAATKLRAEEAATFKASKADLTDGLAGVKKAIKVLSAYYSQSAAALVQRPHFGHSSKKEAGAGGSAVSILEICHSDMQKELSNIEMAESEEKSAYTQLTLDNKLNKAVKAETLKAKKVAAITLKKVMSEYNEDLDGMQTEMDAINAAAKTIKGQCDAPQPETYEEKVSRRTAEIDGLKDALKTIKAVPALLQVAPKQSSLRGVAAVKHN